MSASAGGGAVFLFDQGGGIDRFSRHLVQDGSVVPFEPLPFAELVDKCMSGEIRDGKTVLAVLKAKIYLDAQSAN